MLCARLNGVVHAAWTNPCVTKNWMVRIQAMAPTIARVGMIR
jgi:hypothetical protein